MKQFWGALQQPYEVCTNYTPILQMMKLRAQDLPGVQWLRVYLLMQGTCLIHGWGTKNLHAEVTMIVDCNEKPCNSALELREALCAAKNSAVNK